MTAELRQLIQKARDGGGQVLATLVRVEGSSYRRPGARLLLDGNGGYAGTISGGCLEGDLVRRAKWLIREGATLQHYSTAFDDAAEVPFGLGCGGELDLLLEPADSEEFQALLEGVERSFAGVAQRVVTWMPREGQPLRRAVFPLSAAGTGSGGCAAGPAHFASRSLGERQIEEARTLESNAGWPKIFVEELHPPQRLLIFGAGDDAKPIVRLGAMLGWSVTVADGRPQLARKTRFPEAERVLVPGEAGVEIRSEDAVVLMTHSYEQDRMWLRQTLPVGPRYLGLLGARHRSSLLVSEVASELGWTVAQCCERLHAPVGLDLGGDGPEAIGLAVAAEIQGCVQGKPGRPRRLSAEDVAEQVARGGASAYLQAQCAMVVD